MPSIPKPPAIPIKLNTQPVKKIPLKSAAKASVNSSIQSKISQFQKKNSAAPTPPTSGDAATRGNTGDLTSPSENLAVDAVKDDTVTPGEITGKENGIIYEVSETRTGDVPILQKKKSETNILAILDGIKRVTQKITGIFYYVVAKNWLDLYVVIADKEEPPEQILSFKEIREMMSKKLPNLFTSLASTMQAQQDEEFNDTNNHQETFEYQPPQNILYKRICDSLYTI